ncbi:MAG: hypothetical protein Q9217_006890 [Psora testacea]
MANVRPVHERGTFSRLVPVSRSVAFQHPSPPRDRAVPAPCPCLSSQSSGIPEEHQSTIADTVMATVQSSYTDAIGNQQLSPSTQELYRLVAKLAGYASGSDEHPFTPTDASDAVRCIDEFVRETASELNATSRDLSRMTEDTGSSGTMLQLAIILGTYREEELLNGWEASDKTLAKRPKVPLIEALTERVNDLVDEGWNDLDLDLALFSVRAYARRCFVAHGDAYDLSASKKFADLADYLEADDNSLESLLPDEEKPLVDKYRRLLTLSRDVTSERTSMSESAFRASIDMGRFRPPGIDGPPPVPMEADLVSYRRHSVPVTPRGTKRPAEGQPSSQPRAKVARGLSYPNVRPATKANNMSDEDFGTLADLVEQTHCLADQLNLVSPKDAKKIFAETVPRLERGLKSARAAFEKETNHRARSIWDKRYKKGK